MNYEFDLKATKAPPTSPHAPVLLGGFHGHRRSFDNWCGYKNNRDPSLIRQRPNLLDSSADHSAVILQRVILAQAICVPAQMMQAQASNECKIEGLVVRISTSHGCRSMLTNGEQTVIRANVAFCRTKRLKL